MEAMLLEDAIREEKQRIAELDKALLEHRIEINVEELSNSTCKIKQQQGSKCDTDKLNSRTKNSTMPS